MNDSATAERFSLTDKELAARANQEATFLVTKLLPKARVSRNKRFLELGSIGGEEGQSLKINLTGHVGWWTDFSAAEGSREYSGDIWKLVAIVRYGGVNRDALANAAKWIKSTLGLDNLDPNRVLAVRREIQERQRKIDAEAEAERESRARSAWFLWSKAVRLPGTPAESYLIGRGIDFRKLGKTPGSLRYRPDVWCMERSSRENPIKFPAMVAGIVRYDPDQAKTVHVATHRTYLNIDGWDHATRSGPVSVVKIRDRRGREKSHKHTLGQYAGGHVPVWKGEHDCTLWDIPEGTAVYVSEGIEDGASLAMAFPERRIVAAVAIANMGGMHFPPQIGPVVFIGQNDPTDSKAVDAFERAIERQQDAGRQVETLFPPAGYKDFNDLLMGKRQAGPE
ncbi:MAG TPA: toprim domain-containing protein [Pseudolabrys sp.]|nr:toprim domain-containing protein [Pseudolabrys sp.]